MKEIKKSFWDFVTVLGTSFLSIPLMIASESVQARYLGPDNYGKVALIISAMSLLFLFGLSWLRLAIIRYGKEEFLTDGHIRKTTASFSILSLLSFFVISSIFYIFRKPILNFLEIEKNYVLGIIILGMIFLAVKNFLFEVLKVIRKIKVQTFLNRLATKFFIFLGILLFVFKILEIKVIYVVLVFLLSDLIIIILGFINIDKRILVPFVYNKSLIKKMCVFSFPLLFFSWSSYIITWIDTYTIKYFMSLEDVGIYQASYKILNALKSFFKAGIVTITTPIIIVFKTNNEIEKIKEFYLRRLLPQISFFTMILVAFMLVFSDIGFNIVYGDKFNASILPFKVLITTLNLGIITASLTSIRVSFDMTKMYLYLGIFVGVFNFILDVTLVPLFGIIGAATASFLVFSINPIIWLFIIQRKFELKRKLALFFPIFTFLILLINVFTENYYYRIIITFLLIVVSFLIARNFNLFNKKDAEMLNKIEMPEIVKKVYSKILQFSDKS